MILLVRKFSELYCAGRGIGKLRRNWHPNDLTSQDAKDIHPSTKLIHSVEKEQTLFDPRSFNKVPRVTNVEYYNVL
jgi:hypothetical protein